MIMTKEIIKCTIWKIGSRCYRIKVNDIRYRKLDTGCIADVDTLFACMKAMKEDIAKRQGAEVVFDTFDAS